MKRAIAIRHVAFEDLGLIEPLLKDAGYALSWREAGIDSLFDDAARTAELVILLGGPIGVYECDAYPFLDDEIALAQDRIREGRPLLGICLGAQIMARALGARVFPAPVRELGWARLRLTEEGRRSVLAELEGRHVLHWHGDTYDPPIGAVHLAFSDRIAQQAFACGAKALALQFHLEAEEKGLERWYVGHALEIGQTDGIDVLSLRADAARYARLLAPAARSAIGKWLSGLG
ncbi:GMP synthase [Alphaproteobacteria bacterium]|nr:GMP synthase [Alphaproteobacteria bacterium]